MKNINAVIIPCYNEEKTIKSVIEKVYLSKKISKIIIIDDGSRDKSLEIIKKTISIERYDDKVISLYNEKNCGKGYTIRRGIEQAKRLGCNYILTFDSDGERDSRDIDRFVNYAEKLHKNRKNDCFAIIGQRNKYRDKKSMIMNNICNIFINSLFSDKTKLNDSLSGSFLFTNQAISKIQLKKSGFEIETEILLQLIRNKVKIYPLDINVPSKSPSKLTFAHANDISFLYNNYIVRNVILLDISFLKKIILFTFCTVTLLLNSFIYLFLILKRYLNKIQK